MSQILEFFTNNSCQLGLGLGIGIGIGICILLASTFLLTKYCKSKKNSIEIALEMTKIEKDRFPDDQKSSLWITFDGDPNNKSELTSPSKEKDTQNKGTFLSESTDVFVITPNRRTFFYPEIENLNFGDF
jgi:hypothetical protein